jgi:hypothetical protein
MANTLSCPCCFFCSCRSCCALAKGPNPALLADAVPAVDHAAATAGAGAVASGSPGMTPLALPEALELLGVHVQHSTAGTVLQHLDHVLSADEIC